MEGARPLCLAQVLQSCSGCRVFSPDHQTHTLALNAPQVADFGLSKQKQATYVSGVTSLRGTLPWIAPEIIKTPKEVDEKARLGCRIQGLVV